MFRLAVISFFLLLGNLCYCQGVFSGGVIPDKLETSGDLLSPPPPTLPEVSSNEHRNIRRSEDFILTAPRDPIQEMDLSPDRPSGTAWAEPKTFDPVKGDLERFMRSPCFQTLGYIPDDPGLEERYRRCEESKRNDQIAKVSLWAAIIAGLLGAAWFAFKAFNPSKGSKARALR